MKKKLKELLAQNKLKSVFNLVHDEFGNNNKVLNHFIGYDREFESLNSRLNKGTITQSNYEVQINSIVDKILIYIDQIEDVKLEKKIGKVKKILNFDYPEAEPSGHPPKFFRPKGSETGFFKFGAFFQKLIYY